MNFFQAQDRARRNTLWLVLLFPVGVAGIILMVYVVVFYGLPIFLSQFRSDDVSTAALIGALPPFRWDKELLLHTALGVVVFLTLGSLFKMLTLSLGGGKKVAESLGGQLVLPSTRDAQERQLLNVVDEMAIAAGAPVPDVYLMPDMHVNAFAAGTTPHNAVIGVTHGAVKYLSREELQGVIAHEYSHIMNGDMRMNIRMTGIIHGVMLMGYIGYYLFRGGVYSSYGSSRSRQDGEGGFHVMLMLAGVVLIVIGTVGSVVGSMIRAAVSRQREFLADAAAVQYTRNPHGIAGALDNIRRREVKAWDNPSTAEFAHMFFSNVICARLVNPFSTHPPLHERIELILPDWPAGEPISKGVSAAGAAAQAAQAAPAHDEKATPAGTGAAMMAGLAAAAGAVRYGRVTPATAVRADEVVEQIGAITPLSLQCAYQLMAEVPPAAAQATEEPYAARALVYALLLDKAQAGVRAAQLQHLDAHADTGVAALTSGLWPEVMTLPVAARLPLVQMALPALHLLSPAQYGRFKENMAALIAADEKVSLNEWALQAVVVHHLQEYFGEKRRTYGDKVASMEYALSILAQAARHNLAEGAFNAAVQQVKLPLAYIESKFQSRRLLYALQHIAALKPRQQEQFAQAAVLCASHDGRIDANEEVLLRAYFSIIGCPLPLFAQSDG